MAAAKPAGPQPELQLQKSKYTQIAINLEQYEPTTQTSNLPIFLGVLAATEKRLEK